MNQHAKESDSDEPDAAAPNATASADEPEVEWSIPVNPFMKAVLEGQRRDFIKKFGKLPADSEPLFFDPAASDPEPTSMSEDEYVSQLIWLMDQVSQLTPARDYAVRKCGFVASTYSWRHLPPERRSEWTDAINEYYSRVGLPPPRIEEELVQLPEM